jgi:hypothetical protein
MSCGMHMDAGIGELTDAELEIVSGGQGVAGAIEAARSGQAVSGYLGNNTLYYSFSPLTGTATLTNQQTGKTVPIYR